MGEGREGGGVGVIFGIYLKMNYFSFIIKMMHGDHYT